MLTYVPLVSTWFSRRDSTGGSNAARYCYAVWLRHLVRLSQHGFQVHGAAVGELGPGDSIGTGLAALLSGAERYVGLDVVPYSAKADLASIFTQLTQMYLSRQPIPGHDEFPAVRPRLTSYDFPSDLLRLEGLSKRSARVMSELRRGFNSGEYVTYRAPWTSVDDVASGSLDLIFSQSALQAVDDLEQTYRAMFTWLKPGGFSSHAIPCHGQHLSPFWNGHWAYSDAEWQVVRGRRKWLINREPLSTHLRTAERVGFDILQIERQYADDGLGAQALARRFRTLDAEDLVTRGAMVILRKPRTN